MGKTAKPNDVLADILRDATEKEFHGVHELNQLIMDLGREGKGAVSAKRVKVPLEKGARKKKRRPNKKTTHYLLHQIFFDLDTARDKLRELLPDELRGQVTKSGIVNRALQVVLEDFEEKGPQSKLVKSFFEKIKEK